MGPIPQGQSGIKLKEGAKVFSKENCEWGSGRRYMTHYKAPNADLDAALAYEHKPLKNPRGVYVSIESDLYELIKQKAKEKNAERASAASLIREMLESKFMQELKR